MAAPESRRSRSNRHTSGCPAGAILVPVLVLAPTRLSLSTNLNQLSGGIDDQECRSRRIHRMLAVGEGELEPPRPFGPRNLNPARLPIPPLARARPDCSTGMSATSPTGGVRTTRSSHLP